MERPPEIVVHVYTGDVFVLAKRIPQDCLEDFTRKAESTYCPPVEVRVVA